jgi:hypothetical protein
MAKCPACGKVFSVYRARTTGPGSQSAHLHGHLQQIAEHAGYSMGEVKEAMKEDLASWPVVERFGHMIHASEADVDTMVESEAVDWTHQKAAFLGIILREG